MNTLIAISGLGIATLLLEILNLRKIIIPFALLVLLGVVGLNVAELNGVIFADWISNNMMSSGRYQNLFNILMILLTSVIILTSCQFYKDRIEKLSDFVSLKIFTLAGAIAMIGFSNLIMFFLGLEVLSISVYALATAKPENLNSNEAGMKYFLMGAVASAFILFGIALVYGAMSTFDTNLIHELITKNTIFNSTWLYLGVLMISIGMFFKCSIFPFQFWAPDVYQGAPTINTAVMSTLVKVAALGSFFLLGSVFLVAQTEMSTVILVLGVLTMTVANITALRQKNIKRTMAYSGIAHAGFMILFMALGNNSVVQNDLFLYVASYSLAALACFMVIMSVCQHKDNEDISNFYGLFKKSPFMASIMIFSLMSLGGIPFFAGFLGKFFLLVDLMYSNLIWVAIFCIINSVIAIYYYFNIINMMFRRDHEDLTLNVSPIYKIAASVSFILLLLLSFGVLYSLFF